MDARAFLRDLEVLKADGLRPIVEAGRISFSGGAIEADQQKLLQIALANEISVSDLAASWVSSTPEVDVKIAFARQAGDEAGHFQLVAERLTALGFDLDGFRPPTSNPLFDYLRALPTTVERLAAGLVSLEAIAYEVNETFLAYSERLGDTKTAQIYRDIIQPEERAHQQLGQELLVKYAVGDGLQARAREVVAKTLEIAAGARAKTAERLGTACFPGC